jgi:outer membrane protein TolC
MCLASAWAAPALADDGLTLDQAVQLAVTRNERAAVTDLNVVVSEAAVMKSRAAFLPGLAATSNGALAPADSAPTATARAGLQFSQPIIAAPAWPLYSQALHGLDAQRAKTLDDKRQLAFDAAKAYLAVLLADQVAQAAQRKLDAAKANLAATDAQVKAQLVSSNDVTRAQVDLGDSERELANDQGNLDAAYVNLALLLNAKASAPLGTPAALLAASEKPLPAVETLVESSVARRPDLVAQKATALGAHDLALEPKLRWVPTLVAQANGTTLTNPSPSVHAVDGTLSLVASWTLFDGLSREADMQSRGAQAEIADLDTTALVRQIDAQVRTAAAQIAAAQKSVGAAQSAMEASRKSANETGILYRQGLARAIELVDANEQRFLAEVNHATARFALANAYIALLQAMGFGPLDTAEAP